MSPTKTNRLVQFTKRRADALSRIQPSEAWDELSRQVQQSREQRDERPQTLTQVNPAPTEETTPCGDETLPSQVNATEGEAQRTLDACLSSAIDEAVRKPVTIDRLVEQYLAHLSDQRCTAATLRWHRYHLSRFSAWAISNAATASPHEWERDDQDRLLVRRYLSEIGRQTTTRGGQRSAASLKSVQSSLRSFCRWLYATGRLDTDLLAGANSPRLPQTLKETFSADEIEKLLTAAATHSRYPCRDVALIRFMLDTGCRATEVCTLRATDIDWDNRQAKVVGKGRKERFVFVSQGVADVMRRYSSEERLNRTPYFFESEASREGAPLTPSGLLSICKRLGRHAGVQVNPHKFRHTFAITYLRSGGDVFALQKRLGHSQLAMSEHYAKHVTEDLRREHDQHSPDLFLLGSESS